MTQPSAEELLTTRLREAYGDRVVGIVLFGSRARGDHKEWSDYDVLLVLDQYTDGDPLKTYFEAYRSLKPFRDATGRDTTVIPVTLRDLIGCASTSLILNALYEGRIIYDRDGAVTKVQDKLLAKLKELGVERVKEEWGYTWIVPPDLFPFKLDIKDPDPPDPKLEAEQHLQLCEKYLSDADTLLAKGDYVQAGEKLWGAAAQIVKAVAAKRGLTLDTHVKLWDFLAKLRAELDDPEIGRLWASANALHRNFYEVHVSPELVKDYAQDVRKLVEKLRGLV